MYPGVPTTWFADVTRFALDPGEPEVGDAHRAVAAIDEDVVRLEVAVDEAGVVHAAAEAWPRRAKRVTMDDRAPAPPTLEGEPFPERQPSTLLHRDEDLDARRADVVDLDHVRVLSRAMAWASRIRRAWVIAVRRTTLIANLLGSTPDHAPHERRPSPLPRSPRRRSARAAFRIEPGSTVGTGPTTSPCAMKDRFQLPHPAPCSRSKILRLSSLPLPAPAPGRSSTTFGHSRSPPSLRLTSYGSRSLRS